MIFHVHRHVVIRLCVEGERYQMWNFKTLPHLWTFLPESGRLIFIGNGAYTFCFFSFMWQKLQFHNVPSNFTSSTKTFLDSSFVSLVVRFLKPLSWDQKKNKKFTSFFCWLCSLLVIRVSTTSPQCYSVNMLIFNNPSSSTPPPLPAAPRMWLRSEGGRKAGGLCKQELWVFLRGSVWTCVLMEASFSLRFLVVFVVLQTPTPPHTHTLTNTPTTL